MSRQVGSIKDHLVLLLALTGLAGLIVYASTRPASKSSPAKPDKSSSNLPNRRTVDPVAASDQTAWVPGVHSDRGFVGSDACLDCHPTNHASWRDSYHSTMTQRASDKAVVPSFDDVTLASRGRTWELSRRGDEFWARMADPDWEMEMQMQGADLLQISDPPIVDRQIIMTTGSHNFQTYWVASKYPRLLVQLPWFYSIADGQWIPSEDSFLQPESGPQFTHWNAFCIQCHAVGGVPGVSPNEPKADTRVADFGISCEACHGPAAEHVSLRKAAQKSGQSVDLDQDPIVNPLRLSPSRASHVCAQCHSKAPLNDEALFRQVGLKYRAGDDLEDQRHLLRSKDHTGGIMKDHFWNDGACRVGGDEFNGLEDSACFHEVPGKSQISCLSCHSMHHSDPTYQLAEKMDSNRACTQCHDQPLYTDQIETHTHHPAGSAGSQCYNCHMPYTSFALLKGIRSHRIDSPVVYSTGLPDSRPNACNLCHLDKTLEWSSQYLTKWYDAPVAELNDDDRSIAASLLWILKGDAVQRAIVAWHMGWKPAQAASGDSWQAPFVGQLLQDPYAAVRLVANKALTSLPGFTDFKFNATDDTLDRPKTVAEVISRWESTAPQQPADEKLIGPDGKIQTPTLDRLLRQRDNKHIFINE